MNEQRLRVNHVWWRKVTSGKHALQIPVYSEHRAHRSTMHVLPHCHSPKSNPWNKPRSLILSIPKGMKYLQEKCFSFPYVWNAQVPTSPTFGGKSRCSQACIKLSTIPSPNKPASTVSVTTKETLDKKNMMYNKPSCQQSIILLKKKPHHTNMSSEQNFYQHSGVSVHMGNLILQKNYVFWIVVRSYWRCR